jgi:hypothetical protein
MDFSEYVREYELGRAEGTLLRYLSDVYKALQQTVPAPAKTPEVEEIEIFLRAMVRAVDSSLLDEWERMRTGAPREDARETADATDGEADVTRDERGFTVLVRNAMARLLRALARKDWTAAAAMVKGPVEGGEAWTAERFERALAPFFVEHGAMRTDATARSSSGTRIGKMLGFWDVVQVVADVDGDDDWALSCSIDLEESARDGKPALRMRDIFR